jgi:hypothetical protein
MVLVVKCQHWHCDIWSRTVNADTSISDLQSSEFLLRYLIINRQHRHCDIWLSIVSIDTVIYDQELSMLILRYLTWIVSIHTAISDQEPSTLILRYLIFNRQHRHCDIWSSIVSIDNTDLWYLIMNRQTDVAISDYEPQNGFNTMMCLLEVSLNVTIFLTDFLMFHMFQVLPFYRRRLVNVSDQLFRRRYVFGGTAGWVVGTSTNAESRLSELVIITRSKWRKGGYSLASYRGGQGLRLGKVTWDLFWTKWHWGSFSASTLDFPVNHDPSSVAGSVDQIAAAVPSGLSLTPPQESRKF